MVKKGMYSRDMTKLLELDLENEDELCAVGKALSSPVRISIMKLLTRENLIIGEVAKQLNLPVSSAVMHLRSLEQAGLISIEKIQGTRGNQRLCSRKTEHLFLRMTEHRQGVNEIVSVSMPIGRYADCRVFPTCGLYGNQGMIGMEDKENSFFLPESAEAWLLWTSSGYVEYKFSNLIPEKCEPVRLLLSMEICSEAPGYQEQWKSDLTLWINGVVCGVWRCPGDFGARRGRRTPGSYPAGKTQYGLLTTWEISAAGCFVNGELCGETCIESLQIMKNTFLNIRIGNKEDAKYVGGFNLFGKEIGDYDQDIILSMEYQNKLLL